MLTVKERLAILPLWSPNYRIWQQICDLIDQLPASQVAEACVQLTPLLQHWPDEVRFLPEKWMPMFMEACSNKNKLDPRLFLIRSLQFAFSYKGMMPTIPQPAELEVALAFLPNLPISHLSQWQTKRGAQCNLGKE